MFRRWRRWTLRPVAGTPRRRGLRAGRCDASFEQRRQQLLWSRNLPAEQPKRRSRARRTTTGDREALHFARRENRLRVVVRAERRPSDGPRGVALRDGRWSSACRALEDISIDVEGRRAAIQPARRGLALLASRLTARPGLSPTAAPARPSHSAAPFSAAGYRLESGSLGTGDAPTSEAIRGDHRGQQPSGSLPMRRTSPISSGRRAAPAPASSAWSRAHLELHPLPRSHSRPGLRLSARPRG